MEGSPKRADGLVARALAMANGAGDVASRTRRRLSSPLALGVRIASEMVGVLGEHPLAVPSPGQKLALLAAAAQLRAAARGILVSSAKDDSSSVERALGDLVSRTLALVDHAVSGRSELTVSVPSPQLCDAPAKSDPA